MPAYEFGSNLLLCEIAQRKPNNVASFRALPSFKPRLYKIAGEEILSLVRQFEAGEEINWRQNTSSHEKHS